MLDFLMIATRVVKGSIEAYPKFVVRKTSDLMIRGGDFYAVWVEERGLWSTDENDLILLVDRELNKYKENSNGSIHNIAYMWDAETGMVDRWHKYCQKQMRSSYVMLDEKFIFSNVETVKTDYASKKLPYPLEKGSIESYEHMIGTLYSPEERHKLEWAIGAIVTGDSRWIQKFMVLYGSAGTGKSTILNIIQMLFEGYYTVFDAKAMGSNNAAFALEPFKDNPLVAIQHDGDLSRIEDNTRLNSVVSHEVMTVNEKYKAQYSGRFKCFLFLGTNKPVKITDAKSGLIRRLIDVTPSGNKLKQRDYNKTYNNIKFELGAIASHCKDVYLADPRFYDDYIPTLMMGASNDFYNFIFDNYSVFDHDDGITLKSAWEMYKAYCDDTRVQYPLPQRQFREELKNYFYNYDERYRFEDGTRVRNYYHGFIRMKFEVGEKEDSEVKNSPMVDFQKTKSLLDDLYSDCQAQYAGKDETPIDKWDEVKTKLSDIDTSKIHYVRFPLNHIVIDFDLKDENGKKSLDLNKQAASKWPTTYAEISKGGNGIHLHYVYSGDVTKLSNIYSENVEIKTFIGKSALRRRVTECNKIPVANISSGLPLKKGDDNILKAETIKSERSLRLMILKNLNKEFCPGTKPSMDFIKKILDDAYDSGLKYDLSDLYNDIVVFAGGSTNQATYCLKLVQELKLKSEEPTEDVPYANTDNYFFDVEVFPNLFVISWKQQGGKVKSIINPKPHEVEILLKYRLIGFNNRLYDNHILYARLMGYSNESLYGLSKQIISGNKKSFFSEAYNLSYTDIYDYSSKKQSLKKWQIALGIHHKELGLPWDQPVPEELWPKVVEYCENDVIATEEVFMATRADFNARLILAEITGKTPNATTNTLSTAFIFEGNRKPQDQFNYRFMADGASKSVDDIDNYTQFNAKGQPIFPGYTFDFGKSTYRDEIVGEGGYVYAEPGIHINVAVLDIESMHPNSAILEELFGPVYTKRFKELVSLRVSIKHGDLDHARTSFDGTLAVYLEDADMAADLAQALKIVINSVYGLTSAKFENAFKDPRNVDNIVAKRGALFMINLKHEVQSRGFTVAHIKTDSIKIPNPTDDILNFVMEYGQMYGYKFVHEETYAKMCLVNDAVYIAKYNKPKKDKKTGNDIWWTATGTQFAVPYVFKTLFSGEEITFDDLAQVKSVTSALYLDMNNGYPDVSAYEIELAKRTATTIAKPKLNPEFHGMMDDDLREEIAKGHNYKFIGKVGSFCPVKQGGGALYRIKNDQYYAVSGTKGYKWLEYETIAELNMQAYIDTKPFDDLVEDAVNTIAKYGDVQDFLKGA